MTIEALTADLSARLANPPAQRKPPHLRVLEPWPQSKKSGNPWFQSRGYVFVALAPRPEEGDKHWRLWVKRPGDGHGYRARGRWRDFAAVQRTVEERIGKLP